MPEVSHTKLRVVSSPSKLTTPFGRGGSSNQARQYGAEQTDGVFPPLDPHDARTEHTYRLRDDFVSRAEASFFHVLRGVIEERALIFPKVRLADLIYAPRQEERLSAGNRISRKHLDFVLCDPRTLVPVLAIELDDRSHQRQDRRDRDTFLDDALSQAGLPLLHVTARHSYNREAVAAEVARMAPQLAGASGATVQEQPADDAVVSHPTTAEMTDTYSPARRCERCGGTMRLRIARQGPNAGGQFWGCENYPQCRNVASV